MSIIVDTHVHLYPVYRLGKALIRAERQLAQLAAAAGGSEAARVLCLTEARDHHVFAALRAGTLALERGDVAVAPGGEAESLRVAVNGSVLHVIAGRQVVAAERVEILVLTVDAEIPDGLPLAEIVRRARAAGGVPVLGWAPGKWMFRRARVVSALLREFGPDALLLGDTSLRPLGWGEPRLMRAARRRGYRVLAGSDPLPVAWDDAVMGTYASFSDAPFDPDRPVSSLRHALSPQFPAPRAYGRRGSPLTVARRLWRHAQR